MIQIDEDAIVLLDCEEEIEASYRHHRPVAGQFTVARPYQEAGFTPDSTSVRDDKDICEDVQDYGPELFSQSAAAPEIPAATAEDAAHSLPHVPDAACSQQAGCATNDIQPSQRRKRKRKQHVFQPNAQEQQAELRHAAFQPALAAAAAATQAWLAEQGCATLKEALAATRITSTVAQHRSWHAAEASSPDVPRPSQPPAASAQGAWDQCGPVSVAQAATEDDVDYIVLAALKGALRPKLRLVSGGGGGSSPGPAAAVNLFDQVVGNDGDAEAEAVAHETPVLLPPRSRFLMSDVTRLRPLLPGWPGERYDMVVLDPPWENASAKRAWRYPTLPSRNLLAIPMRRLLRPEGGLVALWMTNRERHWRFVERELLPGWGLAPAATWLWLKVAADGRPVAPLDVVHRRPYEVLLLAVPAGGAEGEPPIAHPAGSGGERQQQPPPPPPLPSPPQHLVVVAVPGEHSRKPQLGRLLRRHVRPGACCLEMFARELAAGWTSWGNEPLRFQALQRFERTS